MMLVEAKTGAFGWVAWRVLVGYLFGCGAAALTLSTLLGARAFLMTRDPEALGVLFFGPVFFALPIMVFSLPTFLLIRAALHLARRTDVVSFAALGAINAYGLVSLLMGADTLELYLKYPPDPVVAVAGAVGGFVCWWVERRLADNVA